MIYYMRKLAFLLICSVGFIQFSLAQGGDSVAISKKKKTARVHYGVASFYSASLDGTLTANGERFSQKKYTGANNFLPLGTWVRITNVKNGKSVVVRVNDRMHPSMARRGRVIDLSRIAFAEIGSVKSGLLRVKLEVLGKKKPE
jgi:rare lipoprotein A